MVRRQTAGAIFGASRKFPRGLKLEPARSQSWRDARTFARRSARHTHASCSAEYATADVALAGRRTQQRESRRRLREIPAMPESKKEKNMQNIACMQLASHV